MEIRFISVFFFILRKSKARTLLKRHGEDSRRDEPVETTSLYAQRTFTSVKDSGAFVSLLFIEYPQRIATRQGDQR